MHGFANTDLYRSQKAYLLVELHDVAESLGLKSAVYVFGLPHEFRDYGKPSYLVSVQWRKVTAPEGNPEYGDLVPLPLRFSPLPHRPARVRAGGWWWGAHERRRRARLRRRAPGASALSSSYPPAHMTGASGHQAAVGSPPSAHHHRHQQAGRVHTEQDRTGGAAAPREHGQRSPSEPWSLVDAPSRASSVSSASTYYVLASPRQRHVPYDDKSATAGSPPSSRRFFQRSASSANAGHSGAAPAPPPTTQADAGHVRKPFYQRLFNMNSGGRERRGDGVSGGVDEKEKKKTTADGEQEGQEREAEKRRGRRLLRRNNTARV
ncbi:hypothetical protein GLOTRDRAFT_141657 [Gloeophyllum trabeum ATCC 11539]|uniref:Uncharacterized protein n=1 Tax=Gloeophyllum trabeum (strain ATCC 11539 / FP-39264 / Madison 617) TaxID=670483 RepID=S7PPP7_GLOTA|nr:uncharacterized protein GLOTRDRAFT_141657 [Gloeophyllum trabeum ATCC 11539]EPQ49846.1 hypothetical protein GLOTRDRAFT_141657 [Gloeophyllum trabeum ATCC 11539]